MKALRLFAVFHLNLAYSSIEESRRPEVIRRCYRPLLRLAARRGLPLGIEATGYTLETIAGLDPRWLDELRRLTTAGPCEFIGSGYAQLIGPLVPSEVNAANLRLGNEVYGRLLGLKPRLALVNEQAYSPGLIRHYLDAGYEAIIMEWDNPARHHPEWEPRWRYLPQFACGHRGEEIPLVWSKSIAFQQFQRYAHGEIELEEYLAYLAGHAAGAPRAFPLYANDVEIFGFRPGRYESEAVSKGQEEWKRIRRLFERLSEAGGFQFIRPSQVLELLGKDGAGKRLRLESPEQPIPVKKQGKYNVTRWAVTGPDDLRSNTACWRIYKALAAKSDAAQEDWKELCYLWSSDFRTHITRSRWRSFCRRLKGFEERLGARVSAAGSPMVEQQRRRTKLHRKGTDILREGRFLTVKTKSLKVRLNCQRGLALDGVWLPGQKGAPLYGTLPHGYYDDIAWGSDWYTGHVVLEAPGRPKVTDLQPVKPDVRIEEGSGNLLVRATASTSLGPVTKSILVASAEPLVSISYEFDWERIPWGSFRLGNITLHPDAFDRSSLWYRTENGGAYPETLRLHGKKVEHGEPVSFLVSARHGIGMTGGWAELGDAERGLRVEVDKAAAALIGLVSYQEVGSSFFCRLALSAGEMDETRHLDGGKAAKLECRLSLRHLGGAGGSLFPGR